MMIFTTPPQLYSVIAHSNCDTPTLFELIVSSLFSYHTLVALLVLVSVLLGANCRAPHTAVGPLSQWSARLLYLSLRTVSVAFVAFMASSEMSIARDYFVVCSYQVFIWLVVSVFPLSLQQWSRIVAPFSEEFIKTFCMSNPFVFAIYESSYLRRRSPMPFLVHALCIRSSFLGGVLIHLVYNNLVFITRPILARFRSFPPPPCSLPARWTEDGSDGTASSGYQTDSTLDSDDTMSDTTESTDSSDSSDHYDTWSESSIISAFDQSRSFFSRHAREWFFYSAIRGFLPASCFSPQDLTVYASYFVCLLTQSSLQGIASIVANFALTQKLPAIASCYSGFVEFMLKRIPSCFQPEGFFETFDMLLDKATGFTESDMFKWMRTLITGAVCIPLFAKFGLQFQAKQFGLFDRHVATRYSGQERLPFALDILRSVRGVLFFGSQVISGDRAYTDALSGVSPYSDFLDSCAVLERHKNFTHTGPSSGTMMNVKEYRSLLQVNLKAGRRIASAAKSMDPGVRSEISRRLRSIEVIEEKLLAGDLSKDKDAAMIVILVAPPGVGKSLAKDMVHTCFERARGREYDPAAIATIDPEAKFHENWSNGTRIGHMEEVGITPQKIAEQGDATIKSLLYFGDSVTQEVEKSAVEDKGRTVNLCELLTANTNSFEINAQYNTRFPEAVYRRITFYRLRVKSELRLKGSQRGDFELIKRLGIPLYDIFEFQLVIFNTDIGDSGGMKRDQRGQPCDFKEEGSWMSAHEFSETFAQRVVTHFKGQDLRRQARDQILTSGCEHGSWSGVCPTCREASVAQEIETHFSPEAASRVAVPWDWGSFLWDIHVLLCGYVLQLATTSGLHLGLLLLWSLPSSWIYHLVIYVTRSRITRFLDYYVDLIEVRRQMCFYSIRAQLRGWATVEEVDERLSGQLQPNAGHRKLHAINSVLGFIYGYLITKMGICVFQAVIACFSPAKLSPQGQVQSIIPDSYKVKYENLKQELDRRGLTASRMKPSPGSSKNVWSEVTADAIVTTTDFQRRPFDHIASALRRNLYHFTAVSGDTVKKAYAVALRPQVVLVNTHNLFEDDSFIATLTRQSATRIVQKYTHKVNFAADVCRLDNDLSLVYLPSVPARDITQWMGEASPSGSWFFSTRLSGTLIFPSEDVSVTPCKEDWVPFMGDSLHGAFRYSLPDHRPGMCGVPLVLRVGDGYQFVGIHTAGSNDSDEALSTSFPLGPLKVRLEEFCAGRVLSSLVPEGRVTLFSVNGNDPIVGSPDRTSFLHWQAGHAGYCGTIKNLGYHSTRPKMSYMPTAEFVEPVLGFINTDEHGYLWGVPDYKEHPSEVEPLGYYSPYHKWAEKALQSDDYCDEQYVYKALESFWTRISNAPGIDWSVSPLDMTSVVSGDNRVRSIRKINLKASMGFGNSGVKADHVYDMYSDQAPDGKMFTDEVLNEYLYAVDTYLSNETYRPINKGSLKVEARPTSDGVVKYPRVFCATSTVDVLVGRTYLQPLLEIVKSHSSVFESAVGVNTMSRQWGAIRQRFVDAGVLTRSFGADISGFDTRMPALVKQAVMTLILRMADLAKYSDADKTVLRGYLTDCIFPLILMKNDLLEMPNINVSGRVGTAEFNSLCLSIIYRMVFYYLSANQPGDDSFEDVITLITYGDDSKAGSKVDYFTQETFSRGCRYFGIVATTAAKTDDFVDFVDFDGEEFLHRTWRWDEEYAVWCAPLDVKSMARSLTLNNTSQIGVDLQTRSATESINWELAQHGRPFFDSHMARLRQLMEVSGVSDRVGMPTYKDFDTIMTACYGPAAAGHDKLSTHN